MRSRIQFIAVCLTALLITGCKGGVGTGQKDRASDWTMFRGEPSLSGYTDRRLPSDPVLLWEYKHGVRTVASAIVYKDVTYFCDKHGLMLGIDREGQEVSRIDLDAPMEASFMVLDSVIYFGMIDGDVRAVSLAGGNLLWSYQTEGQINAAPALTTVKGRRYLLAGSYDNNMYTIDAATGALKGLASTGYYINGAAAVWGEYALFGGCDSWLRMVNCTTGIAADSVKLDAYIPSSPAIVDDMAYIADYNGNVYEIGLSGGRFSTCRKLRTAADDEGAMLSMPAVGRKYLYVLADERYIQCLDRKDGTLIWQQTLKSESGESSPLICRDRVIASTKSGIITIYDAATGEHLWEYETGEQIISTPAPLSDRFMIMTARGTLLCFGNKKE
ncbi:MAG: PQQ-binding-like beta-propeller repeat protein [Bacteroidaceae bacterium]|nr:PQQ-binding-like beta-propeller repeat protein [Bacteroidaceae bacterium]